MKPADVCLTAASGRAILMNVKTAQTRALKRVQSGGASDYVICEDPSDGSALIISISGMCRAVKASLLFKVLVWGSSSRRVCLSRQASLASHEI